MMRQVLIPPVLDVPALGAVMRGAYQSFFLEGETMGTYWKLHILVDDRAGLSLEEIRSIVECQLDLVVGQMSHWDEHSELSKINRSDANIAHGISAHFFNVLAEALSVAALTGGAYDPVIGRDVSRAGFGPEISVFGKGGESLAGVGWESIDLDSESHTVTHAGNPQIDLSSIAKGYAIDLVANELERVGCRSYLLEVGGEFRGSGCKQAGEPWWVEMDLFGAAGSSGQNNPVVAMSGISLATSGISDKQTVADSGRVVHHIIDTQTRESICSDLYRVSVLSENCMLADVWATALFTMGSAEGLALANEIGIAAIFIQKSGSQYTQFTSREWLRFLK